MLTISSQILPSKKRKQADTSDTNGIVWSAPIIIPLPSSILYFYPRMPFSDSISNCVLLREMDQSLQLLRTSLLDIIQLTILLRQSSHVTSAKFYFASLHVYRKNIDVGCGSSQDQASVIFTTVRSFYEIAERYDGHVVAE